jgi:hypothetical protein
MVLNSDLFAYLAAFVTIVLAVALTDLIQSTHRLVRARDRIKWDAMPLIAAAFVYLSVLSEFFSLWDEVHVDRFSFYELVWLMTVPTLISLSAFAVLPDEVPESGLDLTDFYFDNRRYLVSLLALATIGDTTRNLLWLGRHHYLNDPRVWWWLVPLTTAYFVVFAMMWFARRRGMQITALIGLFVVGNIAMFEWVIHASKG